MRIAAIALIVCLPCSGRALAGPAVEPGPDPPGAGSHSADDDPQPAEDARPGDPAPPGNGQDADADEGAGAGEVIVIDDEWPRGSRLPEDRAGSEVWREDLDRRLPRSAPDALRYEPGVFVQQTAHSQGSAFLRGMTGQQTLLLFDGIRLNNSTYRQGPNQYFFTLDSQTISSIQVVRGGASTRYGSDALGGVVMANPVEAIPGSKQGRAVASIEPHLRLRGATADDEFGGRVQAHVTAGQDWAFFGGVGGRRVAQLESGGMVLSPADGQPPKVPRFKDDGRTQLGTGFNELTGDGRLHYRANQRHSFKLALYAYRQYDGERTDQCPAAFAPFDECLTYDEQFRTLGYGVWEGKTSTLALKKFRLTASWQRQHERRTLSRPSAAVNNIGRDRVDTLGLSLNARSRPAKLASWLTGELHYGLDSYHDRIASAAWIEFTDVGGVQERSRGQYLQGSRYRYSGAYSEAKLSPHPQLKLRVGGRVSWMSARAPADPDSGTSAVDKSWLPVVGNAGSEWRTTSWLRLLANVDRSFRAPNLDDLTARQQTGPGFQFENPGLEPERATTYEVGARILSPVVANVWLFRTLIDSAVIKSPRQQSECPPSTPQCQSAWTRLQLVNAKQGSEIRGVELSLHGRLPYQITARATGSWTWGEGPNVGDPPSDPSLPFDLRVPLSRIPPLNGTVELLWRHRSGLSASAALRWAALQDRLALADISDERIPAGGTPGFATVDLGVSYRLDSRLMVSAQLENLGDAAYRYHGSSVNGPGRGLVLSVDLGGLLP